MSSKNKGEILKRCSCNFSSGFKFCSSFSFSPCAIKPPPQRYIPAQAPSLVDLQLFQLQSVSKGLAGMSYWGIHVPTFLTFLLRIICWPGLPQTLYRPSEENKQDVPHTGMNEFLPFTTASLSHLFSSPVFLFVVTFPRHSAFKAPNEYEQRCCRVGMLEWSDVAFVLERNVSSISSRKHGHVSGTSGFRRNFLALSQTLVKIPITAVHHCHFAERIKGTAHSFWELLLVIQPKMAIKPTSCWLTVKCLCAVKKGLEGSCFCHQSDSGVTEQNSRGMCVIRLTVRSGGWRPLTPMMMI